MPLITSTGKPRIILGTMTFGPDEGAGARVTSLDAYKSVLDHFQAKGYNEIDTARVYIGGKQEAWTRDAGWKDRGLAVATKYYPRETAAHRGELVEKTLNKSLEELGTDCVDIFYLHAADRTIPFTEPLKKLDELHKQGKFVRLGLSNFTAFEVTEIVMHCKYNNWVRPTVYQGMYNAIQRNIETELIPVCRRFGIDIVVYNPIAGGILSGKYKSKEVPAEGRYSNAFPMQGELYRKRYFQDATFDALCVIEPVAAKHDLTLVEIAFRWLLHHSELNIKSGGNDGLIIGVSSQQQLESNLEHIEKGALPEEVLNALNEAWSIVKPTAANYWHLDLKYGYDTVKELDR